jgi:hypothetical protein
VTSSPSGAELAARQAALQAEARDVHDPHLNVTRWHEELRGRITGAQRRAVLRIKDEWHRRPEYPHQVGGLDICTAVLEDGVRTPAQFADWLARR